MFLRPLSSIWVGPNSVEIMQVRSLKLPELNTILGNIRDHVYDILADEFVELDDFR